MYYQLRIGELKDVPALKVFIENARANAEGIAEIIGQFMIMENEKKEIVACVGVEMVEQDGLLRSLVVSSGLSEAHIVTLFQSTKVICEQQGVDNLYLLANKESAVSFLSMIGFEEIVEEKVPEHIMETKHVENSYKEKEAVFMKMA